jgi:uncharacterized protein YdiU (UPF0061 family)
VLNEPLALQLGLDVEWLRSSAGVAMLAGNTLAPGSDPLAAAYAGHQFGHFAMLGDGRALLLGEHIAPDGQRVDIQLKGSGRTAFSRGGDGRAAAGPMLREYLISEAMHALGIPTTRSLAVVATGEKVLREQPLDGALLTRVASSQIRVGTFEFAAAYTNPSVVEELVRYTLARHLPSATDSPTAALDLLQWAIKSQAHLIAHWMQTGFVHGVMNTDNMALSGETIDYGPCAFIDTFKPPSVFSSIDTGGRYAYVNQPTIAQWNLSRFAETLLPLLAPSADAAHSLAQQLLDQFAPHFTHAWIGGMMRKLGLEEERAGDVELIVSFLDILEKHELDYTSSFRQLITFLTQSPSPAPTPLTPWLGQWLARVDSQPGGRQRAATLCSSSNPAIIPRNFRVEEALTQMLTQGNMSPFTQLHAALATPYQVTSATERYLHPPAVRDPLYRTFCGT